MGQAWLTVDISGMNGDVDVAHMTIAQRIELLKKLGALAAGRM